jgi:cellulose synthase/poly-beta-1,6-N-acetylglucosamine synthase-like glycosyltransferase
MEKSGIIPSVEPISIATYAFLFLALYTEVYLLLAYLEAREEASHHTLSDAELPTVAMIVPCFNEEGTVAGTLHSLLALDYPKNKLSIIAVNDGSTDNTQHVLDTFKSNPQITVLTKENGGKHTAMNMALMYTTADIVGCLDADSFVDSDALKASVHAFAKTGAAAITPAIVSMQPDNWLRFIQQAEYALSVFMRQAFAASDSVFITPGPFSLFRREVLSAIGGWKHAHGTEDMEIAMRLQEGGYIIKNEPRARVFTKTPPTVPKLYKQRVRWTYGFIMNALAYRHFFFKKYGALGMVVFPAAFLSIGGTLFLTGMMLVSALESLYDAYVRISITGVDFGLPTLEFFFFNTTMAAVLAYFLIGFALTLLFMGRSLARTPLHPASVPLYVALYSFLAPWWLMGAVVRASLRAQAPWR